MATRTAGATITDEDWMATILGSPVVALEIEQVKRLPLDHRAGFLLSLMDGCTDLETLLEVCGMARPQALRLVRQLFESGVIDFR